MNKRKYAGKITIVIQHTNARQHVTRETIRVSLYVIKLIGGLNAYLDSLRADGMDIVAVNY